MTRAEQPRPRDRPTVGVSGAGLPLAPPPPPAPGPPERGTAVLVGVLVLVAAVAALRSPPVPQVEATLRVLPERIATSQAGVVVVPVDIDNRGAAAVVEDLVVRAEPVRQAPAASGVGRVGAGSRAGFAVIVQPDCAVLSTPSGPAFAASLTVALRTQAGARREVLLDLDEDPAVAARLDTLCAPDPVTPGAAAGRREQHPPARVRPQPGASRRCPRRDPRAASGREPGPGRSGPGTPTGRPSGRRTAPSGREERAD